jgi:hypothetical protein
MNDNTPTIPGTQALASFITPFNYSLVTISVQIDGSHPFVPLQTAHFNITKNGKFTHAFTPEELCTQETYRELLTIQKETRRAIYFTPNEGNGIADQYGNSAKASNITTFKALFIDDDGNRLPVILEYLSRYRLKPHFIIKTSKNKHHIYLLLTDTPVTDESRLQWKAVQKTLSYLGDFSSQPVTDSSMDDINQLLRLPSFYNLKNPTEPYKVTIHASSNHPKYLLPDIYTALNAQRALDHLSVSTLHAAGLTGPDIDPISYSYEPYKTPEGFLPTGSRRPYCKKFIDHLLENTIKLEDHEFLDNSLIGFVFNHIAPTYPDGSTRNDYLPGGRVWKNLMQYKHDAIRARKERYLQKISLAASKTLEDLQALNDETLPDTFYLDFPGPVGMLVREFHAAYSFIPLEVIFAASLMLSGYLKAHTYRLKNSWAMLNGVIVSQSGSGKSTILSAIRSLLSRFDIESKYSGYLQEPASVQVLHDQVYRCGGVATLALDESSGFLTKLYNTKSQNYETAVRTYMKESTTAPGGNGTYFTCPASRAFEAEAITNGLVAYWFYIQPQYFDKIFQPHDVSDGFLARFLMFKVPKQEETIDLTVERKSPSYEPSPEVLMWVESLLKRRPLFTRSSIREFMENTVAMAPVQGSSNSRDAIRKAHLFAERALVDTKKAEILDPEGFVDLRLSPKGEEMVSTYISLVNSLNTAAVKAHRDISGDDESEAPESSLYLRQREMLCRMIAVCSNVVDSSSTTGLVDDEIVFHCTKYMEFNLLRFIKKGGFEIITESEEDKCERYLVKAILKAKRTSADGWVTINQIAKALSYRFRTEFSNWRKVLERMAKEGNIVTLFQDRHRVTGKPILKYTVIQD